MANLYKMFYGSADAREAVINYWEGLVSEAEWEVEHHSEDESYCKEKIEELFNAGSGVSQFCGFYDISQEYWQKLQSLLK